MVKFFEIILNVLLFIAKFLGIVFAPFIIVALAYLVYFLCFKKMKFIKKEFKTPKKKSKLKRLFIEFPRQFILDSIRRNPNQFNEFGLHMVCGEQGSGKSVTCVYLLDMWKKKFPKLKIRTNCFCSFEDEHLNSIDDVLHNNNGLYGQVDYFSEIQAQFNCNGSKNIPPEMIGEVCMQRKQYKVILGDAQVFNRVAKPLREQTFYLYEPKTLFGCLTFVPVYRPMINSDGVCESKKLSRLFFFVHSDFIRNAYDTREVIKQLDIKGFKPYNEQLRNGNNVINNTIVDKKLLGK